MAVVEHVAHHLVARGGEAQRTSCGDTEVMHRLAAQEFAHGTAEDGEAVGPAAVGRRPCAFQLEHVAGAVAGDDFAEGDGPSVAELAGPVPELVAAVGHRVGLHRVEGRVPGEHSGELVSFGGLWIEAEVGQHLG